MNENTWNHYQQKCITSQSNKFINMIRNKINNISLYLTLNSDQLIYFFPSNNFIYQIPEDLNSDMISLHIYTNSSYKIRLPLGLLGYSETNTTISSTKETAYRVNNILQLLDICQSTVLDEELSINILLSNEKRNTVISQKHPILNQHFKYQNTRKKNKNS